MARIIVIGGGIAGLACAHRLREGGASVVLLEATDRLGGVIRSVRRDGFLFEAGATTVRGTPDLLELVDELGLAKSLVEAPHGLPRFVAVKSALEPVPTGPRTLLGSRLLTRSAKWRIVQEPWVTGPVASGREESVESFVVRRFGTEIHEKLVAPLLSGVYAGDPARLSLRSIFPVLERLEQRHGSVVRGGLAELLRRRGMSSSMRLVSFPDGLETLSRVLGERLGDEVRLRHEAKTVDVTADGVYVRGAAVDEPFEVEGDAVVVATPASVAARMCRAASPEAATFLDDVAEAPLLIVHVGVEAGAVDRDLRGFGFLASREAGIRALGCLWVSSLFPDRAPDGWHALTLFYGGATDTGAVHLDDDEVVETVASDLAATVGLRGGVRLVGIDRYEHAIPQYTIGHGARMERVKWLLEASGRVRLVGNYLDGVSVGDCVRRGRGAAADLLQPPAA